MFVSVVIPALNEQERIANAIQRAREAGADEIIVVDGGSRDDTVPLARQSECNVLISPPGRARQQNAGAASARGDVLLFLHADTWLAQRGIDQIRHALSDPRVLGGAFRQQIEASGAIYRWLEWGNAWRAGWLGLPYGDQGLFLQADVFRELGGFPDVPLMEDLILMRQLRRLGRPVLLPGPLNVSPRRWQRHGVVRQTVRNWSLVAAFMCGVPPCRLAKCYCRHDREPPG